MADEILIHRTEPDEHGNVFHIDAPGGIRSDTVGDAIAWYKGERHYTDLSEPERGKHVWISVNGTEGKILRSWKYLDEPGATG